jgi:hypothetical protein
MNLEEQNKYQSQLIYKHCETMRKYEKEIRELKKHIKYLADENIFYRKFIMVKYDLDYLHNLENKDKHNDN